MAKDLPSPSAPASRRARIVVITAIVLVVVAAAGAYLTLGSSTSPALSASMTSSVLQTFTCLSSQQCLGATVNDMESSSDGATTWVAGPSTLSDLGNGDLESMQCREGRCYAVGGSPPVAGVYTTSDLRHWVRHDIPWTKTSEFFTWSLECVSAQECLVGGGNGQSNDPGSLYRTVDGGATWQRVSLPSQSAMVWSISCATSTDCVALTGLVPAQIPAGAGSDGYQVLVSTDGGRQWSARWRSQNYTPGSVSCAGEHCVVALRPNLDLPATGTGPVLISTNGGRSWSPARASGRRPNAVACASATRCVGLDVVEKSRVYAGLSRDGGATWSWQALAFPTSSSLVYLPNDPQLQCLSATRCVALLTSSHAAGEFLVRLGVK